MPETAPLAPAPRRVLDAASQLFYEQGITAVGVDLIAERSRVTKRTLYNRFGSKDQLVVAYLSERDERWRAHVADAVAAAATPADAVVAPFIALRAWMRDNPRGCAFINALAELPDADHPAHRLSIAQKEWLLQRFRDLAAAASCAEPLALARRLLLLHEGALATAPLQLGLVEDASALASTLVESSLRR